MEVIAPVARPLGKATREAFGEALRDLGHARPDVVVVDADLNNSTRTQLFAEAFPNRFYNVGIAESNLVGVASGLAACGKQVWISSFAVFLLANAFDQHRMSIALPRLNVKLVGTHAGITVGEDGPSQMGVEDVALACALAGVRVFVPADEAETRAVVQAAAEIDGPVYIRCGRPPVPVVHESGCLFRPGKATVLREGNDLTLAANGIMVAAALDAAEELAREGLSARVLNLSSVKPIDEAALEQAARETGALVVAEEHLAHGGLGSIAARVLAARYPVPIGFVNLGDTYAESGDPRALLERYGLTAGAIGQQARTVVLRKSV
ncbi:MAG TPA: transketolase family protein [Armatimonadetes bacterium]|jgi:transketolase|nr:transketolase family protein [Armatimonadota bacterium]